MSEKANEPQTATVQSILVDFEQFLPNLMKIVQTGIHFDTRDESKTQHSIEYKMKIQALTIVSNLAIKDKIRSKIIE